MTHKCWWIIVIGLLCGGCTYSEKKKQDAKVVENSTDCVGYINNCGFIVTSFALKWFTKPELVDQERTTFGENMERSVSFYQIDQLLSARGLIVNGFKGASPSFIANNVRQGFLCIVHSVRTDKNHYFILAPLSPDTVLVYDYPRAPLKIKISELPAYLMPLISGNVLFVSSEKHAIQNDSVEFRSPDPSGADLVGGSPSNSAPIPIEKRPSGTSVIPPNQIDQFSAGKLILVPKVVTIKSSDIHDTLIKVGLEIKNRGTTDAKIFGGHGSCGCFVNFQGPQDIEPGAEANYVITLKRDGYNYQRGTSVAISTNDPDLATALIKTQTDEELRKQIATIRISPISLDLGPIKSQAENTVNISMYVGDALDAEDVIKGIKISSDCEAHLVGSKIHNKDVNGIPITTADLTVRLKYSPEKCFKNTVTFTNDSYFAIPYSCTIRGIHY